MRLLTHKKQFVKYNNQQIKIYFDSASPGPVFTKGLRLSQVLGLNPVKVKTFVSAKFCLKSVFTKGDLVKSKFIK